MELTKMLEMVRLTEDELIGGFISPKKGYYYIVLNRKDKDGKRKPLWISTGLPAIEENEAEAESKCLSARIQYSLDVKNGVADKTFTHETPKKSVVQDNSDDNHSANWVGHSDIRTTVNTYGHLEYHSKKKTAKIIEKSLPLRKVGAANL